MTMYELQILDFIQNHMRNSVMDVIMKTVSLTGTVGGIWFLFAMILFIKKDTRITSISLCFSLVIGDRKSVV